MKNIYRLIANIIFAITIFLTINITYAEDGVADGTTFINGGIGQEEADEIRAKAGTFNLHIYMSEGKNGQSITGVEVAIIDKKGEIKFNLPDVGPILYLQLNKGSYKITAKFNDVTVVKNISINKKSPRDIYLHWDSLEIVTNDTEKELQ